MIKNFTLVILPTLLIGCVQRPEMTPDSAIISTPYKIVSYNHEAIPPRDSLNVATGENTIQVSYSTLFVNYLCTFTWHAENQARYEVIKQDSPHPLLLYRWEYSGPMLAKRVDRIEPEECKQPHQPKNMEKN